MWECLLGVRHNGCPVSDISYTNSRLELRNISRTEVPGGHGRRLLYVRGEPDELTSFLNDCEAHDGIIDYDVLTEADDGAAYVVLDVSYVGSNPSVQSLLDANRIFQYGAISVRDGVERWLLYARQKSAFRNLKSDLESYDNTVDIHRIVDLSEIEPISEFQFGAILTDLTDRQKTVLRHALECGYYTGDTGTTVNDIAAGLDLHETTVWEHLSKAENRILTRVGRNLFSEPPSGGS